MQGLITDIFSAVVGIISKCPQVAEELLPRVVEQIKNKKDDLITSPADQKSIAKTILAVKAKKDSDLAWKDVDISSFLTSLDYDA